MTTSVNTNQAALIALQNLNTTSSSLSQIQQRISTGLKVSSAKDNAAIYNIAQGQRAQVSSLDAVKDSLQRGQSVLDTAQAAGASVSDLLTQLKAKALAYSDTSNSADDKAALNQEYKSLYAQITTVTENASFDGVNLIGDSTDTTPAIGAGKVSSLANAEGSSTIDVAHQDLSAGANGAVGGIPATLDATDTAAIAAGGSTPDFSGPGGTKTTLATFGAALQKVNDALSSLGTGSKQLDNHLNFIGKLQDSLNTGIGNLVDADVAKESASLTALQTKQQLGVQALSIANSAPQVILSLFKG